MATLPEQAFTIEAHRLSKRYPHSLQDAVTGVSFSVRPGEIFGLLGPNGAGKTTIIGILTTMVLPTSGRGCIAGIDVARHPTLVKQRIAVMPQWSNLDRSLRAREILTFHARYHGVPRAERNARADELLKELGMSDRGNAKVSTYSGGLNQRLMLARALMHSPDVLFLDEPTNNLDPQSRLFLWDRIRALRERGVTILLTTHNMHEAAQLCDRIAVMDHGKILVLDTLAELKKLIPGGTFLEMRVSFPRIEADGDASSLQKEQLIRLLGHISPTVKVEEARSSNPENTDVLLRLYDQDAASLVNAATRAVESSGVEMRDIRQVNPVLEDVFIYLTGRNLH